jgi:hypothetical protein
LRKCDNIVREYVVPALKWDAAAYVYAINIEERHRSTLVQDATANTTGSHTRLEGSG